MLGRTLANTLLVVYYSKTETTKKMADEVSKGAKDTGANVTMKEVLDCTITDLSSADGIAFGSPTHYSNMAWQSKKFLDELVLEFYSQGHSLGGKPCGCFTSTGTYDDGRECLRMLELAFGGALKMSVVPGVILESGVVAQGVLSECYNLGKRVAVQLSNNPCK